MALFDRVISENCSDPAAVLLWEAIEIFASRYLPEGAVLCPQAVVPFGGTLSAGLQLSCDTSWDKQWGVCSGAARSDQAETAIAVLL